MLCESPTYLGAINAFNAYQPRFVEVATDDDGLSVSDLERCSRNRTIASSSSMSCRTSRTPAAGPGRRKGVAGVMELVRRFEIPIIEDSPYAEVRFEGEAPLPLKAMEGNEWVVFLGTFSKIFCPGMRLGWCQR